ncbi:MAG: hypothetical protein LUG18_00470 [Candidatus Azobacteroides sp.]|nr:hypothetical protein [Candidatus Azobacteroides sp.]
MGKGKKYEGESKKGKKRDKRKKKAKNKLPPTLPFPEGKYLLTSSKGEGLTHG